MTAWLAVRPELADEPEVWAIHQWSGLDRFSVAARLVRVWGWFDRHTLDGRALHIDESFIDRLAEIEGFSKYMVKVAWLEFVGKGESRVAIIPNWDKWNGDTAKARLANSRRQAAYRRKKATEGGEGESGDVSRNLRDSRNDSSATGASTTVTEQNRTRTGEQREPAIATAQCIDRGVQGGKNSAPRKSAPAKSGSPRQSPGDVLDPNGLRVLQPDQKFEHAAAPVGFQSTLDGMVGILGLGGDGDKYLDQVGFLAKLAYADAVGFRWPLPLWDYVGRAKRKASPAAWLTTTLRQEAGDERYTQFRDDTPSAAHCQWLLHRLATGEIQEG